MVWLAGGVLLSTEGQKVPNTHASFSNPLSYHITDSLLLLSARIDCNSFVQLVCFYCLLGDFTTPILWGYTTLFFLIDENTWVSIAVASDTSIRNRRGIWNLEIENISTLYLTSLPERIDSNSSICLRRAPKGTMARSQLP